jgi:hypothetical protein
MEWESARCVERVPREPDDLDLLNRCDEGIELATTDLYEAAVVEALRRRYGQDLLPLAGQYTVAELPRQPAILFANVSFPERIRTMDVPTVMRHGPVASAVTDLLHEARETVKAQLRASRVVRKRRANPASEHPGGAGPE